MGRFNRFLVPLVVLAVLVGILIVGLRRSPEVGEIRSPLIGKPAPTWELPSLTDAGRTVGSQNYQGRWYVVNVWDTWCVECRAEHDTLLQAQRSAAVPIVGIDWNDNQADALAWLAKLGNPYTAVGVDRDGRAAIDWGVYGAPETFLVNPQGIVVHKHIGALTPEAWQRDFVARLRAAGAGPS